MAIKVGDTSFSVSVNHIQYFVVFKEKANDCKFEEQCFSKEELLDCLLNILLSENDTTEDVISKVKTVVNVVDECVRHLKACLNRDFVQKIEALG